MSLRRSLEAEPERERREEMEMDERAAREEEEAKLLHYAWPGRWPEWASPAHMRRDIARDREEERYGC